MAYRYFCHNWTEVHQASAFYWTEVQDGERARLAEGVGAAWLRGISDAFYFWVIIMTNEYSRVNSCVVIPGGIRGQQRPGRNNTCHLN